MIKQKARNNTTDTNENSLNLIALPQNATQTRLTFPSSLTQQCIKGMPAMVEPVEQHRPGQVRLFTGYTSSLRGPSPQALTLFGGIRLIAMCLRRHCFRGMPTRHEAFLGMPGMSGLCSCTCTHLKKRSCATVVRLVGRSTNTVDLRITSANNGQSSSGVHYVCSIQS